MILIKINYYENSRFVKSLKFTWLENLYIHTVATYMADFSCDSIVPTYIIVTLLALGNHPLPYQSPKAYVLYIHTVCLMKLEL